MERPTFKPSTPGMSPQSNLIEKLDYIVQQDLYISRLERYLWKIFHGDNALMINPKLSIEEKVEKLIDHLK